MALKDFVENEFLMYEPSGRSEQMEKNADSTTVKSDFPEENSNRTQVFEYRKMSSDDSSTGWTKFYAHHLLAIISVAFLIVLLAAGASLWRQKKRRRSLYHPFGGKLPKISKPVDPIVYNYVCTQKPVEFVVPSASQTTVPSPVDPPAAPPTSVESGGALCRKLSLLESGPTFLGGLNPDLYKKTEDSASEDGEDGTADYPEVHQGRIWFSCELDEPTERLVVRLAKVKNIPSRVYGATNCCDPFVRICLLPDERRYLQSRPKKKTCNPKFDETFIFQLPGKSVDERSLKFTVFDNDRGKHHHLVGHAIVPLREYFRAEDHTKLQWRDLEKDESAGDLGELLVSLCYNHNLERLIVTVCEAKGLKMPEGSKILDSVCRLVFMRENRVLKTKKTSACRDTLNPKYNESFRFRLPKDAVASYSVTLRVVQASCKEKDRCLGRVVLGPYMFSRGKGRAHWDEAISAGHKQIRYWHKLS